MNYKSNDTTDDDLFKDLLIAIIKIPHVIVTVTKSQNHFHGGNNECGFFDCHFEILLPLAEFLPQKNSKTVLLYLSNKGDISFRVRIGIKLR